MYCSTQYVTHVFKIPLSEGTLTEKGSVDAGKLWREVPVQQGQVSQSTNNHSQ